MISPLVTLKSRTCSIGPRSRWFGVGQGSEREADKRSAGHPPPCTLPLKGGGRGRAAALGGGEGHLAAGFLDRSGGLFARHHLLDGEEVVGASRSGRMHLAHEDVGHQFVI